MISVTTAVATIVKDTPFYEEGLVKGIISYSALARVIKPQVEKIVFKPVTNGSIIMAIKRNADSMQKKSKGLKSSPKLQSMTVRSNLVELTYQNSLTIADTYRKLFVLIDRRKDVFCTVSQGVKEITLIVSDDIQNQVETLFQKEARIARIERLSSITLSLPTVVVDTPGAYYAVLKRLAWENINIIEVFSTYTELTIVFASKDINKAFSVLQS